MQETLVQLLGQEDPLEEGMATHSSVLAWRISMDRGTWGGTVRGVAELDMTERLRTHNVHLGRLAYEAMKETMGDTVFYV